MGDQFLTRRDLCHQGIRSRKAATLATESHRDEMEEVRASALLLRSPMKAQDRSRNHPEGRQDRTRLRHADNGDDSPKANQSRLRAQQSREAGLPLC